VTHWKVPKAGSVGVDQVRNESGERNLDEIR